MDAMMGTAAGVPFLAVPPDSGPREDAPVVVAWHLLDSPRTEAAFAAAVPLAGLDAWRIYFGLPMTGARLPADGYEELRRLVLADPVLNVYRYVAGGAADEFEDAFAAVREQLGIAEGPIGVMGGSMGGMVAQLVLAESGADVRAAVLINPVVRLRDTIEGLSAVHGVTYTWTPPAEAFAERADFVARAGEVAALPAKPALMFITGEDDFKDAIVRPVETVVAKLRRRDVTVLWRTIPGMGHALAEEPGTEAAPQTPHAADVDRLATAWFTEYLHR
jgi:pimeloyl-ACP methyl ester carboxylesterase